VYGKEAKDKITQKNISPRRPWWKTS